MITTQSNLFSAEICNAKIICNVLKSIVFSEFVVIQATEEGLKFTVESDNSSTSAYLPEGIFNSYFLKDNAEVTIKVSFKALIECLTIYGDDGVPGIKMSYKNKDSPFYLIIKHSDENIIVSCELTTVSNDDYSEVNFAEQCSDNKAVFKGDSLSEMMSDLDLGADVLELLISVDPPLFKMETNGVMGNSLAEIPKSSDMVLLYNFKKDFVSKYNFSNIKKILKVMSLSKKVSIMTGETGLLGLQFVICFDDQELFLECFICAQYEVLC